MTLKEQERCEDVQLEQQTYLGKFCKECKGDETNKKAEKKKNKKKKESKKSKDEL